MRRLALVFNVGSLAFTLLVLATDGAPTRPVYVVLGLLLILVPPFTLVALTRPTIGSANATLVPHLAAVGNLFLLALTCWALVDQRSHSMEPGFIPYVVVIALTPVLSAVVLFRHRSLSLPHA